MAATGSALVLLVALAVTGGAGRTPAPIDSAGADSVRTPHRVVRRFPPIDVWGTTEDPRSSETVHTIGGAALRTLPVDGFADVLALQPGVVAQGEELHVRGGRNGDAATFAEGIGLDEPLRRRPMELPLLALRSADLVSGSPEARYGCGLAGVLDLRTLDPTPRPALTWRWQSALEDRWYDRWAARAATPLRVMGLGVVAAADATLDDTWLPALRSERRDRVAGVPFDWRADDHVLGWVKLAPVQRPQRFSAQWFTSRHLQRPYDPAWSTALALDPDTAPGVVGYNAADHLDVTDERRTAVLLAASALRPSGRVSTSLGWLRTRTVTSVTGARGARVAPSPPVYAADGFHVVAGDDPLYRESGSDVLTLRGDGETTTRHGSVLQAGAGLTYEDVSLYEDDEALGVPLVAAVRAYHAWAPGGFAYTQGRWQAGGLVTNVGLRAEYFTPGPEGRHQTLPWDGHGTFSFSPRLGLAFPISVRDAFSMAYARIHQAPGRDFLYDQRAAVTDRQPLGDPALRPATLISYEAAVKHVYSAAWSLQGSVFYRDLFGQVGMRNVAVPGLPNGTHYVSMDDGHAAGFEWSLVRAAGERRRLELHYTYLVAWGLESRPEGDPYGPVLGEKMTPIDTTPLSWDRRHSLLLAASWPWSSDWALSWSTAVGSPLPWTPKPRRQAFTDFALVDSRRLGWTEATNVNVQWTPPFAHGLTVGLEARNLFDNRAERVATVDGYPNPVVNTQFDDYGAYRTETGQGGGAYWVSTGGTSGTWVPVRDPRLYNPPRTVRLSVGADW